MTKGCTKRKYATWSLTKKGNIRRSVAGSCGYKVVPPVLPDSVGHLKMWSLDYGTNWIWAGDGKNCPCFEEEE